MHGPRPRRPRASGRARAEIGGSSRKPRPPTDCQSSPDKSRRRDSRSGKARASDFASACGVDGLIRQWRPLDRQPAHAFALPRLAATCLSASGASAAPGPDHCRPRPRSVSSTATSAAAAPKPRSPASISMCASRGSSGSAAIARPCGGQAAVGIDRAERRQAPSRFVECRGRRWVEQAGGAAGRLRPRAGRSAACSTGRLQGFPADRAAAGMRVPPLPTGGWRRPDAWRAARPARWVDRGAAGALGDQPGEARAAVVARAAGKAAVDDDAHVVERDAGLGDAAWREPACACPARCGRAPAR